MHGSKLRCRDHTGTPSAQNCGRSDRAKFNSLQERPLFGFGLLRAANKYQQGAGRHFEATAKWTCALGQTLLEWTPAIPIQAVFLSGDRNLATGGVGLKPGLFVLSTNTPLVWTKSIHRSCGYVGLADGSVQFFDQAQLAAAVRAQSADTNRLAIP